MSTSTETLFDTLRDERLTKSGRACIEFARSVFSSLVEEGSKEARCWVKLAKELDDTQLATQLGELQEKFGIKSKGREAAERLKGRKKAAGDNVVAFPAKDGI